MKLIILAPGSDHLPERFEQDFGIVVGPEGGFSKSEMDWLDTRGVFKLGLGRTRLRGSLAPLIGCGKLMGLNLWS